MKVGKKKALTKKTSSVVVKNGGTGRSPKYAYPDGEPMSKADIATFKAWEKTYANREHYLELTNGCR